MAIYRVKLIHKSATSGPYLYEARIDSDAITSHHASLSARDKVLWAALIWAKFAQMCDNITSHWVSFRPSMAGFKLNTTADIAGEVDIELSLNVCRTQVIARVLENGEVRTHDVSDMFGLLSFEFYTANVSFDVSAGSRCSIDPTSSQTLFSSLRHRGKYGKAWPFLVSYLYACHQDETGCDPLGYLKAHFVLTAFLDILYPGKENDAWDKKGLPFGHRRFLVDTGSMLINAQFLSHSPSPFCSNVSCGISLKEAADKVDDSIRALGVEVGQKLAHYDVSTLDTLARWIFYKNSIRDIHPDYSSHDIIAMMKLYNIIKTVMMEGDIITALDDPYPVS